MVKIGKYNYELSDKKDKKLMVIVNNKKIHFGQKGYSHFFDRSGLLNKSLNHKDEKRRKAYRKRHSGILLKNGKRAIDDPNQPAWHSFRILW